MASYFIGMNRPASGFGSGGNFVAQLGQIGPAWQRSFLNGLNVQNAYDDFEMQQMVNPYRAQAAASQFGRTAMQNTLESQMLQDQMTAYNQMQQVGSVPNSTAFWRELGYNPDSVTTGATLAKVAPTQAQPNQSAMTGGYASTAPNATQDWRYGLQGLLPTYGLDMGSVNQPNNANWLDQANPYENLF